MSTAIDIYNLDFEELKQAIKELGYPSYCAVQIWQWLYNHYVDDFDGMTNLSKALRTKLKSRFNMGKRDRISVQYSTDKQTKKVLFKLDDGNLIETVCMCYNHRFTLCISSQAGCAMGCVFCATGQMGFSRNLTTGEIVSQVIYFARELAAKQQRVSNLVMMGMGEPLHNYRNSMAAIDRLTDPSTLNLGARKITVSTVGLVPAIRRFADEKRQIKLAVSLHAATDTERDKLIRINKKWPVASLIDACRYYIDTTGRRITFEWALIQDENDTVDEARKLGKLIQGMNCYVNLIPLNPTGGYTGIPSSRIRVNAFQKELSSFGVTSTVRVRRGIDIQAGCGQLRNRLLNSE